MPKPLVSDNALVQLYLQGDESALSILVSRHQKSVFHFILSYVKNSDKANEIFQDTFFKVITALKKGEYTDKGRFRSWLFSIAYNVTLDTFKYERKMMNTISTVKNKEDEDVDIFSVVILKEKCPYEEIFRQQTRKRVRRLVRYLSIEQREVLILRHYFGMTFPEIAQRINTNQNTVLGRMHKALINLNKIMEKEEINFEDKMLLPMSKKEKRKIFFDSSTIF